MRIILAIFWGLVAFELATADLAAASAPAPGPAVVALRPLASEVRGYGTDEDKAREHALSLAEKEVTVFARNLKPSAEVWTPTRDFLEKNIILGTSAFTDLTVDGVPAKECVLRLRTPDAATLQEIIRQDRALQRDERRYDRILLLAKVLGGLTLLLGLLAGYLFLEERFCRAPRGRLRLAFVALLALGSVGLLFIA